jgi:hypothetical protein
MEKLQLNDLVNSKDIEVSDHSPTEMIKLITVNNLLSKENLKTNTRIKFGQVGKLSKLFLFGVVFQVPFITELANNIIELQISINGLGRRDLVELVSQVNDPMPIQSDAVKPTKKDIFK